ncbi:hypothetical protein [Aquidulcibacter sp.]|jgi:hypothetical protein|uniref:hypothetical protein n=1 Tax=Aquidulcibacter sp. TaxID=2052990 RepID=UPI003784D77A
MKSFITSFIGFSSAYLIYYLLMFGQLDGRQVAIIVSGGFVFAVLFEGLSLLFRRLFLRIGQYYAKRHEKA